MRRGLDFIALSKLDDRGWLMRKEEKRLDDGLRTPNEGINQRNLICLGIMTDKHASVVIT